eukprot:gene14043-18834_t
MRTKIGRLVDSIRLKENNILSISEEGIISSLNVQNGDIIWRDSLLQNEKYDNMALLNQSPPLLVTLSNSDSDGNSHASIRAWNPITGKLQWEETFHGISRNNNPTSKISDLSVDAELNMIVALLDNRLHFFNVPNHNSNTILTPRSWSWDILSSNNNKIIRELNGDGRQAIISSLLPRTHKHGFLSRVAYGCFTAKHSLFCEKTFVLTANMQTFSVEIEIFPQSKLSLFQPHELKGAIATDQTQDYQADDVLFGLRSDVKSSEFTMILFSLGDLNAEVVPIVDHSVQLNSAYAVYDNKALILVGQAGEIVPAVTICFDYNSNNQHRSHCVVRTAYRQGDSPHSSHWSLKPLSQKAENQCNSMKALIDTSSPFFESKRLFYHKLAHHRGLVSSISCIDAIWNISFNSNDEVASESFVAASTQSINIVSSRYTEDLTDEIDSLGRFDFPVTNTITSPIKCYRRPNKPNNSLACDHSDLIKFVNVFEDSGEKKSVSRKRSLYLIGFEVGKAVMLSHNVSKISGSDGKNKNEVLWLRDESLAQIRDVVVMERPAEIEYDPSHQVANQIAKDFTKAAEKAKELLSYAGSELINILSFKTNSIQELLSYTHRHEEKLRFFGFNQIIIFLTYSSDLQTNLNNGTSSSNIPFKHARVKLTAVDLLKEVNGDKDSVIWNAFPIINLVERAAKWNDSNCDGELEDISIISIKLMKDLTSSSVILVISTKSICGSNQQVDTFIWQFDVVSGRSVGSKSSSISDDVCAGDSPYQCKSDMSSDIMIANNIFSYPIRHIPGFTVTSILKTSSSVMSESPSSIDLIYMLLLDSSERYSLTPVEANKFVDHFQNKPIYSHLVNKTAGVITIFKTRAISAHATSPSSFLPVSIVSNLQFDPEVEVIIDVSYPLFTPTHSRFDILGDDSVLAKYLNPHLAVVITISPVAAANSNYFDYDKTDDGGNNTDSSKTPFLHIHAIDTATGRIIKRIDIEFGVKPVHSVIVDNHVIVTYWNSQAKRTELSSIVMYEGVIDKYELSPSIVAAAYGARAGPSAYKQANNNNGDDAQYYSSYSSIIPIHLQKTYILPKAVTAISHTCSAQGITNKNILIGFVNGQTYSVDMRQIHPRRPMGEPSQSEKEEGMLKYNPFVILHPQAAVTLNSSVIGYSSALLSIPARLESSSIIISYAKNGESVDFHINRVIPSGGFDMIASDFNYMLLMGILGGLGLVVMMLKNFHQRKQLKMLWK